MPLHPESAPAHSAHCPLAQFWWVFFVRGALTLLFAAALTFARDILGTPFYTPAMLVSLSLLLGFFLCAKGLLLGTGAALAAGRGLRIGFFLLSDCLFDLSLGIAIAVTIPTHEHTLAALAGVAALGSGIFQLILSIRTKALGHDPFLLRLGGGASLIAATYFLLHRRLTTATAALWLSLFELMVGIMSLLFAYTLYRHCRKEHASQHQPA